MKYRLCVRLRWIRKNPVIFTFTIRISRGARVKDFDVIFCYCFLFSIFRSLVFALESPLDLKSQQWTSWWILGISKMKFLIYNFVLLFGLETHQSIILHQFASNYHLFWFILPWIKSSDLIWSLRTSHWSKLSFLNFAKLSNFSSGLK